MTSCQLIHIDIQLLLRTIDLLYIYIFGLLAVQPSVSACARGRDLAGNGGKWKGGGTVSSWLYWPGATIYVLLFILSIISSMWSARFY